MTTLISDGSEDRFAFIHDALAAAQAVAVAERLGVFTRLVDGPADPSILARDCAISTRGAAALLAALAGIGLVEATGNGTYRISNQPFPLAELRAHWRELEPVVRTGEPRFAGDAPEEAGANYPRIVPRLGSLFAPAAERFAEELTAPGLRVLDLGAGAAPWSLALARHDPACQVTAVDLPSVLTATRQAVLAAGCEAQFTFLGGDLFAADWGPGGYDLAILGNLCHLFDEQTNAILLGKVFGAIRPLGRVAILDALLAEDRDGPRGVVLYALGLLLRTSTGRVYSFSTFADWIRSAGYEAIKRMDLSGTPPISLVTAWRPAAE